MRPGKIDLIAYSVRHAARFLLFHTFTSVSILVLLHDTLLAPAAHKKTGTEPGLIPVQVRRCWLAVLFFCATHLFLGFASCLVSLGIVSPPTGTGSGPALRAWLRLQSWLPSWLCADGAVHVVTALVFLLLCLPVLPASWLGGLGISAAVFLWFALDARCALGIESAESRSRTTSGASTALTASPDRSQRYVGILLGQGVAALHMAGALYLTMGVARTHDPTSPDLAPSFANETDPRTAVLSPRTSLAALRWMETAMGAVAIVAVTVVARLLRTTRLSPSSPRRRAEVSQSPLLAGTADLFRSFAAKSSQRPSMQSALLLAGSLRFSEVVTSACFTWFLLSCGPRRVDGVAMAALFLCSCGLPALCGRAVELVDARSSQTKRLVVVLLVARTVLGAALFVAQLAFLGEAALDLSTSTSTAAPLPTHARASSSASRERLATVTVLLLLVRAVVTMLSQLLPRVWDDVIREDKVLFNRSAAMTTATARLAWAVTQPFQALAMVVLAVCVFALKAPRLGDGAHFADPNGDARRALCVVVALTELCGAGVLAVLWGKGYNITGKHLQFVELGTYESAESNQPV